MATSPDHPELQFVQASGYTKGRADGPPLWIVIHDMEAHETPTTAENTANYFATGAGGRSVSSHYCADSNSVVQCVLLKDVAWTVGNRAGNYRGINWELSGFAAQTREQWLDEFGVAMFDQIAPIIRADAAEYGIPLQRRTIAELKAFEPGITSHNDLGKAFGGTDHTDPGPDFPWDYLLELLTGEGDDMTPEEHQMLKDLHYLFFDLDSAPRPEMSVAGKIETIREAVTAGTGDIVVMTEAQIAAAVRKELDKTKLVGA
jgi:hypothetical protein